MNRRHDSRRLHNGAEPVGGVALGLTIFFGLLFGFPSAVLTAGLSCQLIENGASWTDMDWNRDGHTSLNEIANSIDVGARDVRSGGAICREFFRLKDGLPLHQRCPK